ncbi:ABC transporter ATP-binding protein [Salinibacterium sp. ZJ77]|uniref:ABC transporter ATP-binding protein n=1 Tax=Salinibacterium sp. ZJ77 TaxID=2708337 RepID=UPI001FB96EB8|nr:ABC transporter ATP-binding protein [Salinibacterium sp. ZJ77]
MDPEPTAPTTPSRRPSGSSARRGSASAASRSRTGAAKTDPIRPVEAPLITLEGAKPAPVVKEIAVGDEAAPERAQPADAAESETVDPPVALMEDVAAEPVVDEPDAPLEESEPVLEEPTPEPEVEDSALIADAEAEVPVEIVETPAEVDEDDAAVAVEPQPEPALAPDTSAIPVMLPSSDIALSVRGLRKTYGRAVAVDSIDLDVRPGSFFGIVGPNGAGKTTTLGMVTGMLRPDEGTVRVFGLDVWENPVRAKRQIGVLPDRLRLFDRLTGAEFLYHAGALRGLDRPTIAQRSADLASAFGLEHSLHRFVSDYSAGMTKKIAIAAAMIHAPRLLVLDEPFESVDPVSTSLVLDALMQFTAAGGTVILSSHSMELTERVCDTIAIIVEGAVLAAGPTEQVVAGGTLEQRFVELAGGESAVEGMEWLQSFSD